VSEREDMKGIDIINFVTMVQLIVTIVQGEYIGQKPNAAYSVFHLSLLVKFQNSTIRIIAKEVANMMSNVYKVCVEQ
jgi:hypothetical protein